MKMRSIIAAAAILGSAYYGLSAAYAFAAMAEHTEARSALLAEVDAL